MKYRRISAMCTLAFSLVLCAFALCGCDLFTEDPPQLVIKNESPDPITSVEFWEETPELEAIGRRAGEAFFKQFTDYANFPRHMAEWIAATVEYAAAANKVAQTTPPVIEDNTVIPVGGSRSWDLDQDESYFVRINDDGVHPVDMNSGSLDTVYVFDGERLQEEKK
jgi:hypothetical protein